MKVGDYVRTKDGYISKIKDIGINVYTDIGCWSENYVVKSSPSIIDLIETGDTIKYNPIQNHYVKKQILYKTIKDGRDLLFLQYQVKNDKLKILSIVTKEQFEAIKYKIK